MEVMNVERNGISTGFRFADDIIDSFRKTDLVILAARPGEGKTTFALNVAQHAASIGKKVMVFSAERKRLSEAQGSFNRLDMVIDESSWTLAEIVKKTHCFKQKRGGLDLVIIDYLQLLSMDGRRIEQREKELAAIIKSIKIMAKELDCVVILISQLSRESEQRLEDYIHRRSDIIDSGVIQ